MGKYEPLRRYLENLESNSWNAQFDDVERVLHFALPESARRYSAWWANESHGSHSHSRSWQEAGWETSDVDLRARRLRFVRNSGLRRPNGAEAPASTLVPAELWDRAHRLSGIDDRDALMAAALSALIQREAANGLIALGGTMPDAAAPPRERPFG